MAKASSLISKSIPNLLGGVSQQPDAVRFDNQCSSQDNAFPSVLDGLTKRPPTEHIAQLISNDPALKNPEDYFSHIINLSADEQYVMLVEADHLPGSRTFVKANTDHLAVTSHADLQRAADVDFWLSGWFNLTSLNDYQVLVSKMGASSSTHDTEYSIMQGAGDYLSFRIGNGVDYHCILDSPADSLTAGGWNFFLAWIIDDTMYLRLNAGTTYTEVITLDPAGHTNSDPVNFGNTGQGNGGTSHLDGSLSRMALGKPPAAFDATKLHSLLYNSGKGVTFADISDTDKTTYGLTSGKGFWFALDEESGDSADSIGSHVGTSSYLPDSNPGPTIVVKKLSDGSAVTTHSSVALREYLRMAQSSSTAEKDLRAITIADYTFLVNRSKEVAFTSDTDTARNPEGLLYVKTGDYGTIYTATITIGGVEYKTEVTTPSGVQVKEYETSGGQIGNLKANTFDAREARDTANIGKALTTGTAYGFNSFRYPTNATTGEGEPDGGTITEYIDGAPLGAGEIIFRADATNDHIAFATSGSGDTITDSNEAGEPDFLNAGLEAGDKIFCSGSAESGNNSRVFEVDTVTATVITITESGVVTAAADEKNVTIYKLPSEAVAGSTSSTLVGIRNAVGITRRREGSVAWFKSDDATDFSLTASDGLANTALVSAKAEIAQLTDLPTFAPHDFFMKVLGNADETLDDYYIKFKADDGVFSTGSWEETRLPGVKYKLDPATMPHALIKESDGTFRFTQLDETELVVGPTTYPAAPIWGERMAGDLDTNPNPTFIGRTINDMFVFKNRLGLLADENVILSETSEFFNFFRTTVLDLQETAYLDVASTHSRVSILTSDVPLSKHLILFSDSPQFILGSGNAPLGPETLAITKTTSYDSVLDLQPISLGSSIYFGFSRGNFSGLRQYLRSSDTETIFDAEDISAQAPQYIEGSLRQMTGSTHEDVIFLSTDINRNVIYCYKFHDRPDSGRVQSSWSRFVFPQEDDVSIADVIGMEFVVSSLYLIMKRTDGIYLERMRLESGLVDTGATYRTLLDRRTDDTACTFSGPGNLTITLPYKVYDSDASSVEIITKDGNRVSVVAQTNGSADITVNEDLSAIDFFVGEAYTMTYEFSNVVLRETTLGNETALISQGRKQVRYLSLDYHDTSFFKVTTKPDYRDTSTYSFTGRILGEASLELNSVPLDSGVYKVPIYSKADQVTIKILNDSPLPCAISSAEFEMLFSARSSRF